MGDVLDDIHPTPTFAPKLLYYVLPCHDAHSVFIEIRLEATISERVQIICIEVENLWITHMKAAYHHGGEPWMCLDLKGQLCVYQSTEILGKL
jgi:hypothetical protein